LVQIAQYEPETPANKVEEEPVKVVIEEAPYENLPNESIVKSASI